MRLVVFLLALFLFVSVARGQWDDPDDDPDDSDDDDPPRWTSHRQPTPTRGPASLVPTRPTSTIASPTETEEPPPPVFTGVDSFANATMYQPDDESHHLTSPWTENLSNRTVLAVWSDSQQPSAGLAVYRSTNDGFSWFSYGTVKSNVNGRKLLEPHILRIEGSWSSESNPTLLAVNAVDAKSTNIELYGSWDSGKTWEFVQRVAEGGPANASKAVGEPFLLFHDNRLTVYYSDQRGAQHAQKISHQSTADMWEGWGSAADVAVSSAADEQHGAASVAKLPNNQYIIVFETAPGGNSTAPSQAYFKLTSTPEKAGTEKTREIVTTTGIKPKGAPFVTWAPIGGTNGTLVLSDSASNSIFTNQALGEGPWKVVQSTAGRAYAKEVRAVPGDTSKVRIVGGSENKGEASDILVTVMDLEKALATAQSVLALDSRKVDISISIRMTRST